MMRFFNWFFFFFSLGSLLAVTVLLYTSRTTTNWAAAGATAPAPPPSPPASSSSSPEPAGPQRFKKLVGSPLTQNAAAVVLHGARCPTDPAMLYDIDVGKAARNKRPWRIVTEGISASQIPPVLAAQRWRARTQGP